MMTIITLTTWAPAVSVIRMPVAGPSSYCCLYFQYKCFYYECNDNLHYNLHHIGEGIY